MLGRVGVLGLIKFLLLPGTNPFFVDWGCAVQTELNTESVTQISVRPWCEPAALVIAHVDGFEISDWVWELKWIFEGWRKAYLKFQVPGEGGTVRDWLGYSNRGEGWAGWGCREIPYNYRGAGSGSGNYRPAKALCAKMRRVKRQIKLLQPVCRNI